MLVISPDTPRGHWPLGRVQEVYPGQDRHVRAVKVQVGHNALIGAIARIFR